MELGALREQLAALYLRYTRPVIIFDTANNKIVQQATEWTNQDAKELFYSYSEQLSLMK